MEDTSTVVVVARVYHNITHFLPHLRYPRYTACWGRRSARAPFTSSTDKARNLAPAGGRLPHPRRCSPCQPLAHRNNATPETSKKNKKYAIKSQSKSVWIPTPFLQPSILDKWVSNTIGIKIKITEVFNSLQAFCDAVTFRQRVRDTLHLYTFGETVNTKWKYRANGVAM